MSSAKRSVPPQLKTWIRALDALGKFLFRIMPRFSQTDITNSRVLFVCLTDMADVIQTLPALQSFKKRYPNTQVDYLTGQWAVGLVENHPDVSEIIVYNAPWVMNRLVTPEMPSSHGPIAMAWELRKNQYKAVISFRPDIRVNVISLLINCPVRAGYRTLGGSFLLTDVFEFNPEVPKYQRHLEMLKMFEFQPEYSPPLIIPREPDVYSTQSMLQGLPVQKTTAVVYPGGNWRDLRWPEDRFARICRFLCENGFQVLLLGGPGETKILEAITQDLKFKNLQIWNFPTYGEIAALARHTDIFISSNSCPAHIMGAMNVPCIVLMGSPVRFLTEPLGQYLKLLYPPRPCADCQESKGPDTGKCECMKLISVEMMLDAFQNLVSSGVVKPKLN